ncbi:MAG TPA: GerMN domain-containing protein [Candidatus Ozemobacteraceae bacterium]|nr:GerMN domain-containing protein [Candidatus Ozemobacteraceae bacterium]
MESRKKQRKRQESFLFLLMGFILLCLLVTGYFVFMDKILPSESAKPVEKPPSVKAPASGGTGEAQTVWAPGSETPSDGTGNDGQLVALYFGARGSEKLVKEMRKIPPEKMALPLAGNLVKEILRGPFTPEARAVVPQGTVLRSIFFHKGTFYVDFSKEFADNHPGGAMEEALTVFSVVNTLTELDRKARVKILISGMEADSLKGHMGLRQSLCRYEPLFLSATGG